MRQLAFDVWLAVSLIVLGVSDSPKLALTLAGWAAAAVLLLSLLWRKPSADSEARKLWHKPRGREKGDKR